MRVRIESSHLLPLEVEEVFHYFLSLVSPHVVTFQVPFMLENSWKSSTWFVLSSRVIAL